MRRDHPRHEAADRCRECHGVARSPVRAQRADHGLDAALLRRREEPDVDVRMGGGPHGFGVEGEVLVERVQADGLAVAGEGDPGWREMLEAEVDALERDPYRLPWRDDLPAATAASFEPFRERLETSYSEICNPLEIGMGG